MLYIKNKKILISPDINGCVAIWSLKTYQSIMKINCLTIEEIDKEINVYTLFQLNEETILVGGEEFIVFVDIKKGIMTKKELFGGIGKKIKIQSIIKLRDNKSLLCAEKCKLGNFLLYNTESDSFIRIKTTHKHEVEQLLNINENTFVSNGTINDCLRIWKY